MFVLTVDQRGSRTQGDRVPAAIDALQQRVADPVLGFERTAGDEIQGVLASPDDVVASVRALAREGGWSIGIGAGAVEDPLPASTRAARGPALLAAREAVESARRRRGPRLAVRGPDVEAAEAAEAALRLLLVVLSARSSAAWEAADLVSGGLTHAAAARRLGITRQAVGQRLASGNVDVEREAGPVIAMLLGAADT